MLPRPQWVSLAPVPGDDIVQFAFFGLPDQRYQAEFKDALDDPVWVPVETPILGTGAWVTLTAPVPAGGQRFFRLVVLP